jgi:hypothetical protein
MCAIKRSAVPAGQSASHSTALQANPSSGGDERPARPPSRGSNDRGMLLLVRRLPAIDHRNRNAEMLLRCHELFCGGTTEWPLLRAWNRRTCARVARERESERWLSGCVNGRTLVGSGHRVSWSDVMYRCFKTNELSL